MEQSVCICLPNGEKVPIEGQQGHGTAQAALHEWQAAHPELAGVSCEVFTTPAMESA